jgi:GWxTD domain-containing protein
VARAEYIAQFWKAHDVKAETSANETREEFERRVAFADVHFAQDEKRGSLTDRGMVFVLLGPPTWVGRRPFVAGEDWNDPKGMALYSELDLTNALKADSSPAGSAMTFDKMTAPGTKLPDSDSNYHEIWHYRRELLPATISFQQMDFDFITRKGYGHNVLQREGQGLATLEMARQAIRAGTFTRTASK